MKNSITLLMIFAVSAFAKSFSQNTWIQKADFGGTARYMAAGFSIGNYGYIGTGAIGLNSEGTKDFWQYDPVSDAWTQKADFGGNARFSAVGFSIGSKGYIGTGLASDYKKDFWEYDPATNAWTRKADLAAPGRKSAVGFAIGNKGYLGTGFNYNHGGYYDFWEYDPALDQWTQKTDFPGPARGYAVGFSIGSKGYIGTGDAYSHDFYDYVTRDFYEYDPATDTWTQKANFGGSARNGAVGFSIGNRGYIGAGLFDGYYKDFWQYNPTLDSWSRIADLPEAIYLTTSFSIGDKGYIGTGNISYFTLVKTLWEYIPAPSECSTPYGGYASQITLTTATVNWLDSTALDADYRIYYKPMNSSD